LKDVGIFTEEFEGTDKHHLVKVGATQFFEASNELGVSEPCVERIGILTQTGCPGEDSAV
jgi:hypothetical protein